MAKVTINCATNGATIRYTTNGADPTEASAVYSSPLSLAGVTLKAKAFKAGLQPSNVSSVVLPSANPTNWKLISHSLPQSINGVCYGNGKFVAVGNFGYICYSTDGITWNASQSFMSDQHLYQIAYGAGKFVAVGSNANIAYSIDGITWTKVTNPFGKLNITKIAYGGDKFVVAGGGYGYSTDGITWTKINIVFINTVSCICYGNDKCVKPSPYSNGGYGYSTDGITWTKQSLFTSTWISNMCYDGGKFVAVGNSGEIWYSTNGTTWGRAQNFTTEDLSGLAYGAGKFVTSGWNGTFGYSADGITWVGISQSLTNKNFPLICYGNGRFVCLRNDFVFYCDMEV